MEHAQVILDSLRKIQDSLAQISAKLNTSNNDKYYTSAEVRKLLNISENTLIKMRRLSLIKHIKIGDNSYRYPKSQFGNSSSFNNNKLIH
jgi:hypothetical protein